MIDSAFIVNVSRAIPLTLVLWLLMKKEEPSNRKRLTIINICFIEYIFYYA